MAEVTSSAEDRIAVLRDRDPENLRAENAAALAPASHSPKVATATDPSQPIIALEGVTYTYEGESEPVLRDLSLTVRNGEFVLILGPSGCGKSTLLNLLNGSAPHLLHGTLTGGARVFGKSVAETKVVEFATEVGMVFQDPDAQIINSRVRDEVCFASRISAGRRPRSSPAKPKRWASSACPASATAPSSSYRAARSSALASLPCWPRSRACWFSTSRPPISIRPAWPRSSPCSPASTRSTGRRS
jgi:hypothetical protein